MQKDAVLDVGTRKLFASGNSETEGSDKFWPLTYSYINRLRTAHGEGFLDGETKIWSQPDGSNEEPRCEHNYMGIFMSVTLQAAVHPGKNYTENFSIYQESTQEIFETIISSDSEVMITDMTYYWRDDSADRHSCSVCNCQNLRLF